MARIDTLTNFLTDVSNAIRQKTGGSNPIPASTFDTEILSIETVGNYQEKNITITENGTFNLLPDTGYDALSNVRMTIDVEGGTPMEPTTATQDDVISPKTFYSNGQKLLGSITPVYGPSNQIRNATLVGETSYYVLDYLPEYELAIIMTSTTATTLYISKYDPLNNTYDLANAFSINVSDFGTIQSTYSSGTYLQAIDWFSAAKFGALPYEENIYNVCIQGRNGSWDTKMIGGFRFNVETLTMEGSIIKNRIGESWNIYNSTYWTLASRPGTNNEWLIVPSSNRSNNNHTYRIIFSTNGTVSGTQVCTVETTGKSYGMYNETGRFCITFRDNYTRDIYDITFNRHIKQNFTGISCIINDTYIFANYTLYDISSGEIVKTFSAVEFGNPSILALAYRDSVLYIFTSNSIMSFMFDNTFLSFSALATFQITYNIHQFTYAETLLSFPDYKTDYLLYGDCVPRTVGKVYCDSSSMLIGFNRQGTNYYTTEGLTATPSEIIDGKTATINTGKVVGTMPNNGATQYTPSTSIQNIANGYHNGSTIRPVTSDIDINIIPENIRNGVTILGVNGSYTGSGGGDATSDANLQAKYLLEGYSMVADGHLIAGTMHDYGNYIITATSKDIVIPEGHYNSLSIPIINASNCEDYTACNTAILSI